MVCLLCDRFLNQFQNHSYPQFWFVRSFGRACDADPPSESRGRLAPCHKWAVPMATTWLLLGRKRLSSPRLGAPVWAPLSFRGSHLLAPFRPSHALPRGQFRASHFPRPARGAVRHPVGSPPGSGPHHGLCVVTVPWWLRSSRRDAIVPSPLGF